MPVSKSLAQESPTIGNAPSFAYPSPLGQPPKWSSLPGYNRSAFDHATEMSLFRKLRTKLHDRSPSRQRHTTDQNQQSSIVRDDANKTCRSPSSSAITATSSSTIWDTALVKVQNGEYWPKYSALLQQHALLPKSGFRQGSNDLKDSIFAITNDLKHSQQPSGVGSSAKVDKVVNAVLKFKAYGDALAGLHPYAQLGWSITTSMAAALQSHQDIRALCLANLPRICELGRRYVFCESIDTTALTATDQVEEAMIALYHSILEYQLVMVITLYSRLHRVSEAFGDKADSDIQSCLTTVALCENSLQALLEVTNLEIVFRTRQELHDVSVALQTSIESLHDDLLQMDAKTSSIKRIVETQYLTRFSAGCHPSPTLMLIMIPSEELWQLLETGSIYITTIGSGRMPLYHPRSDSEASWGAGRVVLCGLSSSD